jgi:probable F420-dependent oxidoreductase
VKVGLVIANTGTNAIENVQRWPAEAESLGYSSVWFTDHVVGLKAYAPRFGPIWMESLTSLAYAAAGTRSIGLGVGVMVVPYRNPVYVAKVLATIDLLSEGRLRIGVGVGWSRSEYKALGVGDLFDERGKYTDEALDVMRQCWAGGTLGYQGKWNNFREIDFLPAPVQKPHPQVWVGGHSKPALRRAAEYATVWHPMGLSPEEFTNVGDELDELAGRKVPRSTRILVPADIDPRELSDQLSGFAHAGCIEIAVDLDTEDAALFQRSAERLAEQLKDAEFVTH